MTHKRTIAIIPARGGSKRIPHKNVKKFLGKPIIAYSILAALRSKCFDTVMVSTDDKNIAKVAERYGATVPFFRSEKTSNNHAHLAEVIHEVLSSYKKIGHVYDQFCCLLATAPFVTPKILQASLGFLQQKNIHAVLPIIQYTNPIQRALIMRKNILSMVNPAHYATRSQDLPKTFYDAGQFYMVKVAEFNKTKKLYLKKTYGIIIDEVQAQDIDNAIDWKLAEMKYKLVQKYKI